MAEQEAAAEVERLSLEAEAEALGRDLASLELTRRDERSQLAKQAEALTRTLTLAPTLARALTPTLT